MTDDCCAINGQSATDETPNGKAPETLLIVGGGAAAFAAATRAADLGVEVTMINDGLPLGGTCVNVGCVPSKHMLEAVRRHHDANHPMADFTKSTSTLDFAALKASKDKLVASLRTMNYHDVLDALGNVDLIEGRATFTEPREVEVNGRRLTADRILIATGARTRLDGVPGLAEARPLTNITALELEQLPESLAVIGAGPLGIEFAQIFARAGTNPASVHLFGRILPQHEPEIQANVATHLANEGISVHAGRRVVRVEGQSPEIRVHDDQGNVTVVEQVLAATGITPNSDGLGLDVAGIGTNPGGFIEVDARQQTNVAGVYAAGDVTDTMALETVAAKQGYNAAHNAITGESRTVDYDQVPHAVYADPQVASVGWTEERMMQELGSCLCRTLPMEFVPKAHAAGDTRGLVKLVIHRESHKILGAHAVGVHAAEIIHVPLIAIRAGWTIDDLIETVHAFPTYAEAWKMCAQSFTRDVKAMSCCIV